MPGVLIILRLVDLGNFLRNFVLFIVVLSFKQHIKTLHIKRLIKGALAKMVFLSVRTTENLRSTI